LAKYVAKALTTMDPKETVSLMNKYGATYIFITRDDATKAGVLFKIVGENLNRFIPSEGFTKEGKRQPYKYTK